jgi:endoglucanase
MNRRKFLEQAGCAAALVLATPILPSRAAESPAPTPARLPRWRGFNLLEKFVKRREGNPPFRESDFQVLAEWGFDFVRLPMSYLCWAEGDPASWLKIREEELKHVDQAMELGRKHGVHVNLNFHRAPGYCVNPPKEPLDLWKDGKALEACAHHWAVFAKRYQGIPNNEVSFDLLNEPPDIKPETYISVVQRLADAIRAEDKDRLIIASRWRAWPNCAWVKAPAATIRCASATTRPGGLRAQTAGPNRPGR